MHALQPVAVPTKGQQHPEQYQEDDHDHAGTTSEPQALYQ